MIISVGCRSPGGPSSAPLRGRCIATPAGTPTRSPFVPNARLRPTSSRCRLGPTCHAASVPASVSGTGSRCSRSWRRSTR